MRFQLLLFLIFIPAFVVAQNLVPNPSFESFGNCPATLGMVDKIFEPAVYHTALDWYAPNMGSTDYYRTCGTGGASVPYSENVGYQVPRTGDAYMAIITSMSANPNYSEYLEGQLLEPLHAGHTYAVSFWVNNGALSTLATDCLGAYFSAMPLADATTSGYFAVAPQIQSPPGSFFTDTLGWTEVSGLFVAAGGEEYISLGLFSGGAPFTIINTAPPATQMFSYLLVDDVSVIDLGAGAGPHDTSICLATEPVLLTTWNTGAGSFLWNTGHTGPALSITHAGLYWVRASYGGLVITDTFRVSEAPTPDLGADRLKCAGDSVVLQPVNDFAYDSYLWQNGVSTAACTTWEPGQFILTVQSGACVSSDTVQVTDRPEIRIDLGVDRTACAGDTVMLQAPAGFAGYAWNTGATTDAIAVTATGTYWVAVGQDCPGHDTVALLFYRQPPPPEVAPDVVFCQGTKQAVLPVTGENLTWYTAPGSTGSASQPVVNTQTAGDGQSFSVTQTVRGCTSAAAQVTVHIQEAIALHLGPDQMICNEETALLQADLTAAQYRWNTGDTTPYLAVKASGNYSLTVIDGACQATDEVRVLVQDCGCVRMPTAFTPNSDGSNDRLSPLLRCPDATYTFLIFDRWGNEVFSGQTGIEGWDGTVHGQPCPGGVYIYLVTYRQPGVLERPRQVTGNVLLLR